MPRARKGVSTRPSKWLDTIRFFVIASEGADTERIYFEALQEFVANQGINIRIKIEFLKRETEAVRSRSAHLDVLRQLDTYKRKFEIKPQDELWLVADRDRQSTKLHNLAAVAQQCEQKGYGLAISNPCFELWLLLHCKDVSEYSDTERQMLFENKRTESQRTALEKALSVALNGYNKSKYQAMVLMDQLEIAIERAERLDIQPETRWIEHTLNTRDYLLVRRILAG